MKTFFWHFQIHMKSHHDFEALESLVSCMTDCGCNFTPVTLFFELIFFLMKLINYETLHLKSSMEYILQIYHWNILFALSNMSTLELSFLTGEMCFVCWKESFVINKLWPFKMSGGELLELRLLDTQLLDTFGRKSTARHFFWQLLESS
jgi:hypothetical protein